MDIKGLKLREELFERLVNRGPLAESLMDNVLDGVFYSNLERPGEEWLSPRYAAKFGYSDEEIENNYTWWRSLMLPEDLAVSDVNLRKALNNPAYRYDQVARFRHRDGRIMWIHTRADVIRDDNGRPFRLLGCHMDATHLMEMEQVSRFGTVIEHCITEIYIFDAVTLKFIQANRGARLKLGYTMDELQRMTPMDIKPPLEAVDLRKRAAALRAGPQHTVSFESEHVCKDGRRYPVEVQWELSHSSARSVFIAFVTDITEKKAREQELEATKELNEVILNSVSDGIAGLQPVVEDGLVSDYKIIAANHAMRRQFHRFGGPLVGTRLTEVMPEFRESELFMRLKDVGERGATFAVEIGPSKSGQEWYLVRAMRTANSGITITFINITDSKQRELHLRKSNEALRQFSGIVSHDLQAPLRHIRLFSEMLDERLEATDTETRFLAGRIRDNITRMQRMVASLLEYTTMAYGQINLAQVDLNAVVADVQRMLESDIKATGARITVGTLPILSVDRDLMTRLFQNLMSNALKYRGQTAPAIDIAAACNPGFWEISISDNGIGIPAHFDKRIFDVFTRLHRDEKTYPGLGIGLALCKQIVESHKGEIWLDISYTEGARFCFTLPSV